MVCRTKTSTRLPTDFTKENMKSLIVADKEVVVQLALCQ